MRSPRGTPLYAIAADVGGTSVRCGLVSAAGRLRRGSYRKTPVDSKGPADAIIKTFVAVLRDNLRQARRERLPLAGIGIGMCGPLDYENGIVLMRGLDKYDSLYGMNLKQAIRERLGLDDKEGNAFPLVFEPDSWAFARGEAWLGAGKGFRRILALTLGTGFGSAFVADGEILGEGPGVPPPFGWIGSLPFRGGLLDDAISRRGILTQYRALSSAEPPAGLDVRDLAAAARKGDAVCRQVFEGFGQMLGAALGPIIRKFGAECLIFGGRISKSFDLFDESLRCGLHDTPSLRRVTVARSINLATLWGAARLVFTKI